MVRNILTALLSINLIIPIAEVIKTHGAGIGSLIFAIMVGSTLLFINDRIPRHYFLVIYLNLILLNIILIPLLYFKGYDFLVYGIQIPTKEIEVILSLFFSAFVQLAAFIYITYNFKKYNKLAKNYGS